jgi:hypothetical protein
MKVSVKCEALRDITPIVERNQREETLRIGDYIIQKLEIKD